MKNENIVKPIFEENNIPIVFNCDDNFIKYFAVTLQSIIDNCSENNNYDIILLNEGISFENKNLLTLMIKNYNNISIRYFNMQNLSNHYNISEWFYLHLNKSAYYRLFVTEIFKFYERIIYLDCDLIVQMDLLNLFNQNLENYVIGAVKDFCVSQVNKDSDFCFQGFYKYTTSILNINNITKYFNSGVMLLDIKKMIRKKYFEKFIEVARINNKFFHDQNVLNSVLNNDLKLLNTKFNVQQNFYDMESTLVNTSNDRIFHFCSKIKPWNKITNLEYNDILWWNFARKTPFYEVLLFDRLNLISKANTNTVLKDKFTPLQYLFSIINSKDKKHKIICILGLKIKVKRGKINE